MKKTLLKRSWPLVLLSVAFTGCTSDGGPSSIGAHGTENLGSGNKLGGLYLLKLEANEYKMQITSHGDVKVGI